MSTCISQLLSIYLLGTFLHSVNASRIKVADWDFYEVRQFFTVCSFVLCLIIVKFIHSKVHWMHTFIPESFVLLTVGVIFGLIFRFAVQSTIEIEFRPKLFFLVLLPPIILNSAYEMTTRPFYKVFGICIMFAVLATILNFIVIGFILTGVVSGGQQVYGFHKLSLSLRSILLFSSLIVAVDPVAVLAIFNDIGMEHELYFIMFGESLLNDAVTVVLYQIMQNFLGTDPISGLDIGMGIASFFTVSLGGLLIGVAFGVLTCLATRFDNQYEVVVILLLAYISYIVADTIKWSGIIAMISCGMIQAEYSFKNITPESRLVLRKMLSMLSSINEGIIFLFLGESMANIERGWHTGFVLWSLFICIFTRAVVSWFLTLINNTINLENRKISNTELLILIYGGLRGAVAFSLAKLIKYQNLDGMSESEKMENQYLIINTTLFIILFTIGVHGLTMKPLVKLLHIRVHHVEDLSLFRSTNDAVIDTLLPAIEGIVGEIGENIVREKVKSFNNRFVRPLLQRQVEMFDDNIMEVLSKTSLAMHYAMVKPNESSNYLAEIPERLRCNKYSSINILTTVRATTKSNDLVEDNQNHQIMLYMTALANTKRLSLRPIDIAKDPATYFRDLELILTKKRKIIDDAHSKRVNSAVSLHIKDDPEV